MEERGKQYDKPEGERSMGKTVQVFNIITGHDLTEADGWLLMQILKDVRQWQTPNYHEDSALDCVAYSALKAESLWVEHCENHFLNPNEVKWNGGSCPVDPDTVLFVGLRNGQTFRRKASECKWEHTGSDYDVMNYEEVVTPPAVQNDGWIKYNGEGYPFITSQKVEVKFRDGTTGIDEAVSYSWCHDGDDDDIVAYRLVTS